MSRIVGFWNNEGDDGFGIALNGLNEGDFELYRERIVEMARELETSPSQVIKDFTAYAKSRHATNMKETFELMSKITWLEWNGHLASDNYNGMMYMRMPEVLA